MHELGTQSRRLEADQQTPKIRAVEEETAT